MQVPAKRAGATRCCATVHNAIAWRQREFRESCTRNALYLLPMAGCRSGARLQRPDGCCVSKIETLYFCAAEWCPVGTIGSEEIEGGGTRLVAGGMNFHAKVVGACNLSLKCKQGVTLTQRTRALNGHLHQESNTFRP